MGVITYTDDLTSPIPPSRLFKALVLDSHNLIPKLMPQAIKSIDFIQGNGGPGSIRQVNFAEGSPISSIKNRIDEVNEESYYYKYTVIEGDALAEKLEFIVHEVQFEPTPEGGSKNKMTTNYHTKGDILFTEEEIKAGKEKVLGMYKVAEAYLLQNPDAYA
ncbi:hypothetical protein F2P56_014480 [Juglans regia]|uniref:Bet v I/Major latex protein domain-containing protein n=2 Tax=Juglans regia TaxID=51240 RepID=A0A834CTG0_JUGRE|nr:major allergen Pru ar 1-like [Juglans regia]KAF5464403.1 hypothetical protein F2P56_014480 [Juglans regia]